MPDRVKEKLVELKKVLRECLHFNYDEFSCNMSLDVDLTAENLIAHGVTVLEESIKMVIPEGIDEKQLMEMIRNAPIQILPGEPVPEWISVKDRLPEENERVLVYHDDGVIRFGINKGGFADVVSSRYLKHNHRTCFSKVTHWMPLPQPPKE